MLKFIKLKNGLTAVYSTKGLMLRRVKTQENVGKCAVDINPDKTYYKEIKKNYKGVNYGTNDTCW